MQPMGMSGRKKLTALYREHDVPGELRSSMLVVADARQIIWAVGVTTAEETRVTPNTKQILKLSLKAVL
jgi:tRNA(Ile)-lysidine synthase